MIDKFQSRVLEWILRCFSNEIVFSQRERKFRFLEESLELVQALDMSETEVHNLVDYVFNRKRGLPTQEVGGVLVCLSALCSATDIDMMEAGETELARISTRETIDSIRFKHASKPKHIKGLG